MDKSSSQSPLPLPMHFQYTPGPINLQGAPSTTSSVADASPYKPVIGLGAIHSSATVNSSHPAVQRQRAREQSGNQAQQSILKNIGRLELKIAQKKIAIENAKLKKDADSLSKLHKELSELKMKLCVLDAKRQEAGKDPSAASSSADDDAQTSVLQGSSSRSENEIPAPALRRSLSTIEKDIANCQAKIKAEQSNSIGKVNEKALDKLEKQLQTLEAEQEQAQPRPLVNQHTHANNAEVVSQMIKERQSRSKQLITEIQATASSIDGTGDQDSLTKELQMNLEEIESLHLVLETLQAIATSKNTDDDSSIVGSARKKNRDDDSSTVGSGGDSSDSVSSDAPTTNTTTPQQSNLSALGKSSSKVYYPQAGHRSLSAEGLIKVIVLDAELENLSRKAKRLSWRIEEHKSDGEEVVGIKDKATNKTLRASRNDLEQTILKIGKTLLEKKKIEQAALSSVTGKTKEEEAQEKAFFDEIKSAKTTFLEGRYTSNLERYKKAALESPMASAANVMWNLAAGVAGFAVSFLGPNTWSRYATGVTAALVHPVWAGVTHVVLATPVVKQLMLTTWNSPAMAELTNYHKLVGSSWRDARLGETAVKKYLSKNPADTQKLSIEERLAQEKNFFSMMKMRYLIEDLPYFSYTFDYGLKAELMQFGPAFFHLQSTLSKGVEAGTHGVAGGLSGALYVVGQQGFRSAVPGAKQAVVPSYKIFNDQYVALESYANDLQEWIEKDVKKEGHNPQDPDFHKANIKLRQIKKELYIASHKRWPGGIFAYELKAQFNATNRLETISESLGRSISLLPTAWAGYLTAGMRLSPNPVMQLVGYVIPAVALMAPPGFTSRAFYSGAILTVLESMFGGRDQPSAKHFQEPGQQATEDASSEVSTRRSDEESSGETEKVSSKSAGGTTGEDSSVVGPAGQSEESEDSDVWKGNPNPDSAQGW